MQGKKPVVEFILEGELADHPRYTPTTTTTTANIQGKTTAVAMGLSAPNGFRKI
jgi:hypothetical protein